MINLIHKLKAGPALLLLLLSLLVSVLVSVAIPQFVLAAEVDGEIQQIGDVTHLEFRGQASWNYSLQENKDGGKRWVEMSVPPLSEQAIQSLTRWSSAAIPQVQVDKSGADGSHRVRFQIGRNDIKTFDYLTDTPSRLIVDFYVAAEEVKPKVEAKPEVDPVDANKVKADQPVQAASVPQNLPSKADAAASKSRKPAGTDFIVVDQPSQLMSVPVAKNQMEEPEVSMVGILDGGDADFSRFTIKDYEIDEGSVIASQQNIYLKFPMLTLDFPELRQIWQTPPIYEIVAEDGEENKIARLLHKLFIDNKYAIFHKTLDHFRKNFPNSRYDEMIGYMDADLDYRRWRDTSEPSAFADAMSKYSHNVQKFPDSPLVDRTFMLMGYSYLFKGDVFGTLKTFQRFLRLHPKTERKDAVQLAMAEAYLKINKFSDALKIYNQVAKEAADVKYSIAANYLRGDVYFSKRDYKQADVEYRKAYEAHPKNWQGYPNAYFNRAESLFWQKDYKSSLEAFVEYIKHFPTHSFGGYAMTRIGELLEILGASRQRAMGAYVESYFRYRASPGAAIARVQILAGRMQDMKEAEMEDALKELNQIVEKSTLPKIEEFVKIKIADGLFGRGEYDKSSSVLEKYYQQHPTSLNLDVFKARIVRNIAAGVKNSVANGKFIEALREYNRHKSTWLKNSMRIDIHYFVGQAFEQAGVFSEASQVYRKTLNDVYAVMGTDREKRGTFEKLPKADELNLRLAVTAAQENEFIKANDFLKEITKPEELSFPEQVELVELAARVAEESGQNEMAKNFLLKLTNTWKGVPDQVTGPYIRLAELQMKTGEDELARDTLAKVLNLVKDSQNVQPDHHFRALNLKGDLEVKLKRGKEAVATYRELLGKFETSKSLASVRYKVGELLFDMGEMKEAEKTWAPLAANGGLWSRLAEEKMSQNKWEDNYKKYIKRIPAMDGFKEQKQ